jgi:RNA recognition motif-containing protein
MEPKLYVGNLPYDATEEELRQLFSGAGTVASASIITDRETGRSKGFGFVEMASQAEAEKAASLFNGHELRNRPLKVDLARPREDRPRGGGGGRDRRGGPGADGGSRGGRRY